MPLRSLALCAVLAGSGLFVSTFSAQEQSPPGVPPHKQVTLKADKIPLSKALAELSGQTGIPVEDRRNGPDVEFPLDLKNVPFWQALDTVAAAAGARVDLYGRDGRIVLLKRQGNETAPAGYAGPFRVLLKRTAASRDLETGAHTCTVSLEVAWEPSLQPFLVETHPRDLVLHDNAGHDIPVPAAGSSPAPVDGRISVGFDLSLPALPRSSARIGLLRGKLLVVGPSKMLPFTFDTLDRLDKAGPNGPERRQTREGVVCKITRIVLAKDRWSVQVTLEYPPGEAKLESFQSWVVNNEMFLETRDQSRRLPSSAYVVENSSPQRAVLTYHFLDKDKRLRGRPEDWTVVYTTPASIVEMTIPFSFKDVPLP